MSSKHRDPEYLRNARIVRAQVAQARRLGSDVYCWRCRGLIDPAQQFDVGHLHPDGGNGLDNLAPEHRRKSATCRGNRSHGGSLGAAMTNARRTTDAAPRRSRGLLSWCAVFFEIACNPRLRLYSISSP